MSFGGGGGGVVGVNDKPLEGRGGRGCGVQWSNQKIWKGVEAKEKIITGWVGRGLWGTK